MFSFVLFTSFALQGIYVTKEPASYRYRFKDPQEWKKIYAGRHEAAWNTPCELKLENQLEVSVVNFYSYLF